MTGTFLICLCVYRPSIGLWHVYLHIYNSEDMNETIISTFSYRCAMVQDIVFAASGRSLTVFGNWTSKMFQVMSQSRNICLICAWLVFFKGRLQMLLQVGTWEFRLPDCVINW